MEQEYTRLRNNYLPKELKVIFVLESPPLGHGYFYDPSGRTSEVLFRAYMKLLGISPISKEEGLSELANRGWLLVNPIYTPVNKLPDKEADRMILENYSNFLKDLQELTKGKEIPIILVKSNILRLLEEPLVRGGYKVLNNHILIPFPLHYHANTFQERTVALLATVGL